jgi:hypothetical protein
MRPRPVLAVVFAVLQRDVMLSASLTAVSHCCGERTHFRPLAVSAPRPHLHVNGLLLQRRPQKLRGGGGEMMEPEAVVAGNKACGIGVACDASPGPSRGGDARPGGAISIGDRVQLHSLDRSELNNLCGEIVMAINAETGRWGVKLELDGRELALKPANLIRLCDNGGNPAPRRRSSTAPGRLQAKTVRSWSAAVQEAAQTDGSVRGGGGEMIKPEAVAEGNETRGMEAASEAIPISPRDFQSGAPASRGGVVDICGGGACLSGTTFRVRVCARSCVCPRPSSEEIWR